MTDVERARGLLEGHTLVLCRGEEIITSGKRGISPMMDLISEGAKLVGFSAADQVVGRAAALLFAYAGIREVYAKVASAGALEIFLKQRIPESYEKLTENIVNRKGDGICPMEQATAGTDDPAVAFGLLKETLYRLRGN